MAEQVSWYRVQIPGLPVDGAWSMWHPWSECSVTCGGGTRTKERTCSDPAPEFEGKQCMGDSTKTDSCGNVNCPGIGITKNWKVLGVTDELTQLLELSTNHDKFNFPRTLDLNCL